MRIRIRVIRDNVPEITSAASIILNPNSVIHYHHFLLGQHWSHAGRVMALLKQFSSLGGEHFVSTTRWNGSLNPPTELPDESVPESN